VSTLATNAYVIEYGHLPLAATAVDNYLRAGTRRLKAWIGAAIYAAALAEAGALTDRYCALRDAEALLAKYYLLPEINTVIAGNGGVINSITTGGVNLPGQTTRYYMPNDIEKERSRLLEDAYALTKPYIPAGQINPVTTAVIFPLRDNVAEGL
jgi:hypothetical protein